MRKKCKNNGFSLTEVLLAVGTLAIGVIFVAGVFPVGIYFTTTATERTIAAVVADEAFAKVRIIASDPSYAISASDFVFDELRSFEQVANNIRVSRGGNAINPEAFGYPSTYEIQKQYYWSALCRRAGLSDVQVTVFVCRKAGPALGPAPVQVGVSATGVSNELQILGGDESLINDGYTIVDDENGQPYRVIRRYPNDPTTILLDRDWLGGPAGWVWVVAPQADGGRYPCIAVYQKVIRF